MLAVLSPLIVFGLVIFIHELGHFIAAKLAGVYAPRFSVGFGPAVWRRRYGETEYVLAALPLGGYVRMASRHDAETAFIEGGQEAEGLKPGDAGYDPDAMMPFGPTPVPENRWFESKSLGARLFIMVAGVVMNVLLAFVIFSALNVSYGKAVLATRVVGMVRPVASAPALARLRAGDTILAVNGEAARNWNDIVDHIERAPAGTLALRTQRGVVAIPVTSDRADRETLLGAVDPFLPPVIGDVVPGSPARAAGLKVGDTVVSIGRVPVHSWPDLVKRVSASPGIDLLFEVRRAGQLLPVTVRPHPTPERDSVTNGTHTVGKIGAALADGSVHEPVGLIEGVRNGARLTWVTSTKVGDALRKLVTRQASVKDLGGPIAITRASVSAGQDGLLSVLLLVAMISVNVAILNLLPIPILDGGQILVNVLEAVKGRPFSARTRDYILRVGLAVILLIFAMSTFNDIGKLFRDVGARLFG